MQLNSRCVSVDIVRELLENGADVSLENVYGEGPIQVTLDNEIRLLLLGGSQNALNRWNEAKFQPIPSIALSSFECSTTESVSFSFEETTPKKKLKKH